MKLSKMKVGKKLGNILHWANRKWVKLLMSKNASLGRNEIGLKNWEKDSLGKIKVGKIVDWSKMKLCKMIYWVK